jgi:MYND finger
MINIPIPDHCQVCQRSSGLLRCAACRAVWYCSIPCQRNDWKHHRKSCPTKTQPERPDDSLSNYSIKHEREPLQVTQALNELSSLMKNSSLDSMIRSYHLANDSIDDLRRNSNKSIEVDLKIQRYGTKITSATQPSSSSLIGSASADASCVRSALNDSPQQVSLGDSSMQSLNHQRNFNNFWHFYAEDMLRISCMQILLKTKTKCKLDLEDFEISMKPHLNNTNHTVIIVIFEITPSRNIQFLVQQKLDVHSWQPTLVDNNEAILLRLPYTSKHPPEQQCSTFSLLQLQHADSLVCKFCHHKLLLLSPRSQSGSEICEENKLWIKKVLPLPSNYWEDLSDFVSCYPVDQSTVDFRAASYTIQENFLYEAETMIVAHSQDVGNSAGVLAIPGYGQIFDHTTMTRSDPAYFDPINTDSNFSSTSSRFVPNKKHLSAEIRGPRHWSDTVGGATLTCSVCCSTLGYASDDLPRIYRFLKHCVVLRPSDFQSNSIDESLSLSDPSPMISIASFIAHEMVRYAESRAIFTFNVATELPATQLQPADRNVLILKLLSWDNVTTNCNFSHFDSGINILSNWFKMAKIVYHVESESIGLISIEKSRPLWMWKHSHLCCLQKDDTPVRIMKNEGRQQNEETASSVWLYISQTEWTELLKELDDSNHFFSKEIAEATILALREKSNKNLKLSAVMLQRR